MTIRPTVPGTGAVRRIVVVLLLAACSSGGHNAAPTTTTSSSESSRSSSSPTTRPRSADDATWVGRGPQPLSQLVGAGGRIVYLGVDDQGRVSLVALEPSTGEVAWSRPSTAASHIGGVQQHLVATGDTVFDVEPSGGGNSNVAFPAQPAEFDVVAVDARTGRDKWHHPFPDVTTPLEMCGDGLCVLADAPPGHIRITRLNLATGETLSEGTAAFEPLAAEDGELAISAARQSNDIELTSGYGKTVVWTHQRAERFGTNDVTPDGGWSGTHFDGVWMVWLGGQPPSLGATSGISDDGQLLWTRPDTSPCFPFTDDPMTAPVLCGKVEASSPPRFTIGTVEGIDVSTGVTQWSLAIGDLDVEHLGSAIVRLTSTGYAVRTSAGDVALDIITGPSGAATPPVDGWCEAFGQPATVEGKHSIVATSWSPCTLGAGPNDTPPTAVPAFAGPTVNGFGAWVEDGEVRATKVR